MKKSSLLTNMLYVMLAAVFITNTAIAISHYSIQVKQENSQWMKEQQDISQQLAIILMEPIFNYDKALVDSITQALLKDTRIADIQIYDHRDKRIGGAADSQTNQQQDLLSEDTVIINWPSKGKIGEVRVRYSRQHIEQRLHQLVVIQILSAVTMAILLSSILLFFLRKIVIRPIAQLSEALGDIAGGDGDLTQRIRLNGNLEIHTLAHNFNQFVDTIQNIVISLSRAHDELVSTGTQVVDTSNQIEQHSRRQQTETKQSQHQLEQLAETIESIAVQAQQTSVNTDAMSQVSHDSAQQVTSNLSNIKSLVEELTFSTNTVTELREQSTEISRMLDVIRNIAEQTNLLALNASIEAARAGESGRGFSVVADEVRALAMKTHESTAEIEDIIGQLQRKVDLSFESTHRSMKLADTTIGDANQVATALQHLSSEIEQINTMNQRIAEHSKSQQVLTEESQGIMRDVSEGAADVAMQSASLTRNNKDLQRIQLDLSQHLSRFTYQ